MREYILSIVLAGLCLIPISAWGSYPLITDDTATQGTGKFQLEVNGQRATDRENTVDGSVREQETRIATVFSAGVRDNIDLVIGIPYQWIDLRDPVIGRTREQGIGDTVFEAKWRFLERNAWSFGLKPAIILPTGNDDKGLGAGKIRYGTVIMSQWERDPWEVFLNIAYLRNENRLDECLDLWHASVAAEYYLTEELELVGNIGVDTNADKESAADPAFLIVGFAYEIKKTIELSLGVKFGLTRPEPDFSIRPGIAVKF